MKISERLNVVVNDHLNPIASQETRLDSFDSQEIKTSRLIVIGMCVAAKVILVGALGMLQNMPSLDIEV